MLQKTKTGRPVKEPLNWVVLSPNGLIYYEAISEEDANRNLPKNAHVAGLTDEELEALVVKNTT